MLPLNQLTAAERQIYNDTIRGVFGGYEMKTTVQVLTNRHAVVSTVSHVLLDGQIDAQTVLLQDGDVAVTRTCSLQFVDPAHSLSFDSSSPTDGALYLDRMVRVIVSVRCSFGWVDIAVFTGPVLKVDRDGDIVNVAAAGKETFGLRSAWHTRTYKTGFKVAVLAFLLVKSGEANRYMELPKSTSRITKPVVVGRESKLWAKAFGLASSMDRYLFYDGRGIARTSRKSSKPVATFHTGPGGTILSEPQVSFSTDNLKNAIIVRGGDPAGPKKAVSALVVAPRSHPLSPWTIGRGPAGDEDRGGYLTLREENQNLRTTAKAVARGKALLDESLRMQTEATWDSLPIWHLEPWDMVNLSTDRFSATVRLNKFSMPLRADANMTCGYHKDLRKPRRFIRRTA